MLWNEINGTLRSAIQRIRRDAALDAVTWALLREIPAVGRLLHRYWQAQRRDETAAIEMASLLEAAADQQRVFSNLHRTLASAAEEMTRNPIPLGELLTDIEEIRDDVGSVKLQLDRWLTVLRIPSAQAAYEVFQSRSPMLGRNCHKVEAASTLLERSGTMVDARTYHTLGLLNLGMGDCHRAEAMLQRAVETPPKLADAAIGLALIRQQRNGSPH